MFTGTLKFVFVIFQSLFINTQPENFVVGLGDQKGMIFLIDFGLSKQYRDPLTKLHIPSSQSNVL